MKKIPYLIVVLVMIFSIHSIAQTIPQTINYQGVLKDAVGVVVTNGDYNITFKLYSTESGGTELWTETKLINVVDGIINTQLGSATLLNLPFDAAYWLGITVSSGSELTPRIKLSSVPYSFMTMNVMDGSITTSNLQDGVVTTNKIADNSVNSAKIIDGTIAASDIGDNQVIKKINGIRDSVNIIAGSNVTITPSGNTITIDASGGSSGTIGGSGTANNIAKFTNSTTLGNSVLYELGNKIGLGTTSPDFNLTINSTSTAGLGLKVSRVGGGLVGLSIMEDSQPATLRGWSFSVFQQRLGINATEDDGYTVIKNLMTFDRDGNVGIGTTSILYRFNIEDNFTSNINPVLSLRRTGVNSTVSMRFTNSSDNFFNIGMRRDGKFAISSLNNNLDMSDVIVFDFANNYLGIGTTTPAAKLDVTGGDALINLITIGRGNGNNVSNSVFGIDAMKINSGAGNCAFGYQVLMNNSTGYNNTSFGYRTLINNGVGNYNTAVGFNTLYTNSSGVSNTAIGAFSLAENITGSFNTAVGYDAGAYREPVNYGTFLGYGSYPTANDFTNVMGLGYNARPDGSNQVHIGNASVTSIQGNVGFTTFSDGRYKKDIQEDVKGLDFIMKLRPVTYKLDAPKLAADLREDEKRDKDGNIKFETSEIDRKSREEKSQIVYTGFVAQEVEKAAKEIGYDFSGVDAPQNENGHYGLRYAEFVVPLVKAVQEQQATIQNQQRIIEELTKRIEALERK